VQIRLRRKRQRHHRKHRLRRHLLLNLQHLLILEQLQRPLPRHRLLAAASHNN
jgi:hypothetical protein